MIGFLQLKRLESTLERLFKEVYFSQGKTFDCFSKSTRTRNDLFLSFSLSSLRPICRRGGGGGGRRSTRVLPGPAKASFSENYQKDPDALV